MLPEVNGFLGNEGFAPGELLAVGQAKLRHHDVTVEQDRVDVAQTAYSNKIVRHCSIASPNSPIRQATRSRGTSS